ncbi:MAG TPA: type II secretion system protein [Candidatus Polarisedimenticolia bacterium]|nr:type II secretion system protein [Candidatus Polarisedimenticolia bacterium]
MKKEFRVLSSEFRGRRVRHSSFVIRHIRNAFTLIELLTVIAIIGILAALLAPVLKHFARPDVAIAASRQMLDDVARARQLAISERTTVYMAFVPTNFWNDDLKTGSGANGWTSLPLPFRTSTIITQMYGAQWNGYFIESLRSIGDQPGRSYPKDLVQVKTLPPGAFFAPFKFTAPLFNGNSNAPVPYPTNRPDLLIYGFLKTNTIPFPTADVETNPVFMVGLTSGSAAFVTLPYIAFNYLGQLTSGDGTVLPYDENIPLAYGTIAQYRNMTNRMFMQPPFGVSPVDAVESPPGNSTNISYNVIHIDRLTGRARLEHQDVL